MDETFALEAQDIRKTYGHFPALRGVDLKIRKGTSVTLFGRNGAGKTTFLKIASTLARPTAGSLHVDGVDIQKEPERVRQRIGFLSHNTYVYRDLTPIENLRFFSKLYGLDHPEERFSSLIRQVGLERRRNDPVRSFSRGLLQRVGLARVMLHDPAILLLDEPYTGLDANAVGILNGMLDDAVARGRTVLLTTHDLELGLRSATEAYIIDRGRIVHASSVDAGEIRDAYSTFIQRGETG